MTNGGFADGVTTSDWKDNIFSTPSCGFVPFFSFEAAMLILASNENQERKLALVSQSFALVFRAVKRNGSKNPSCGIKLVTRNELKNHHFRKLSEHKVYGFIGCIQVDNNIFMGVITGSTKVASPIPNETVNRIFAVDFFCISDDSWDYCELDPSGRPMGLPVSEGESTGAIDPTRKHPCFGMKKLLSNGSFYYSTDFDLTSTLQNRGFYDYSLSTDKLQEEYMWNSFLMSEIFAYRDRLDPDTRQILDEEGFLTAVIRGYAETLTSHVGRLKVSLSIISKQSWKRAGMRFNARGIDDDANVANFVETEIIMYSTEYCYAFTQVRGSVPIFWEQDASLVNSKVQITRSTDVTQPIFEEHFLRLVEKYGLVNVVNLLSNAKTNERDLFQRYVYHLEKSKKVKLGENIFLTNFDFNKETAQEGFSAASKIVPLIKDFFLDTGYFSYDVKEGEVVSEQQGVFRTNCMDCLDRTNVIQQLISIHMFKVFLDDFKLLAMDCYSERLDFVVKFNTLWANNGDQISQIYTGTNALKSSFSRKGKMSIAGALSDATKSISRVYMNNFTDKGKQQNIDFLLGRLPHQKPVQLYDPENDYVIMKLRNLEDKFTTYTGMNLLIGTYNVGGVSQACDLSPWLFPIGDKFKPDVVLLGLQEVIKLNAGGVLNVDYTKAQFWEKVVTECLNQYEENYFLLRVEQMASLIILLFVRNDKANLIRQVEGSNKKTGFGGMTGNKGAIAIRFDYANTSFCFVNAHLSAGVSNVVDRTNDYSSITRSISFSRSKRIHHHDNIFWLGDLNYRIDLSNAAVRNALANKEHGYIDKLMEKDQLTRVINKGQAFQDFREPAIQFLPTYKFDPGSDSYDTSEKARTPSWTDRIIYKGQNLHPLAYSSAPLVLSDHRPVYAAYRATVKCVDEARKLDLRKKLSIDYKRNHGSSPELVGVQRGRSREDIERLPESQTSSFVDPKEVVFRESEDDTEDTGSYGSSPEPFDQMSAFTYLSVKPPKPLPPPSRTYPISIPEEPQSPVLQALEDTIPAGNSHDMLPIECILQDEISDMIIRSSSESVVFSAPVSTGKTDSVTIRKSLPNLPSSRKASNNSTQSQQVGESLQAAHKKSTPPPPPPLLASKKGPQLETSNKGSSFPPLIPKKKSELRSQNRSASTQLAVSEKKSESMTWTAGSAPPRVPRKKPDLSLAIDNSSHMMLQSKLSTPGSRGKTASSSPSTESFYRERINPDAAPRPLNRTRPPTPIKPEQLKEGRPERGRIMLDSVAKRASTTSLGHKKPPPPPVPVKKPSLEKLLRD